MNIAYLRLSLMGLSSLCCIVLLVNSTPSLAKEKTDFFTYIHAGMGVSFFGPTFQAGVHYRPGQYSLNFRFISSFSEENSFLWSTNSELGITVSRSYSFRQFSIKGGSGVSAVFVSARPVTYSGGIPLSFQSDE